MQHNVLRRILGQIKSCSGTPFTQVNTPGLSTHVLMVDLIVGTNSLKCLWAGLYSRANQLQQASLPIFHKT